MDDSERAHAQSLRDAFVASFIARYAVTIPRFRRDSFRPLIDGALHPLYGTLSAGITDGVTAWALTQEDRLVHVAFGQLEIEPPHYAGPRRANARSKSPTKPKQPKLDTTDLY